MQPPLTDDRARDPDDRAPSASPRVRLEVELLASDHQSPVPAPAIGDARAQRTVLIVASDADVRRHAYECLRDRTDFRVLEFGTMGVAMRLADLESLDLLIVDAPDIGVLEAIVGVRAVLMVDDVTRAGPGDPRIAILTRPFSGQDLESIVDDVLRR